jgi:hypothetical protein
MPDGSHLSVEQYKEPLLCVFMFNKPEDPLLVLLTFSLFL